MTSAGAPETGGDEPLLVGGPRGEVDEHPGTSNRAASAVESVLSAHRRRRGGSGSSGGGGGSHGEGLLSDDELSAIEAEHPDGITAVQVVDIFVSRGVRFSEASFRKYVQQGLVPRSRRVGRKGKHRGSMGMYPAKTVRRINEVKRLMADGYTIEEIQDQFLRFADVMETLEEGIAEIFSRLESEITAPHFDNKTRRSLERELSEARRSADELMRRLDDLSRRALAGGEEQFRGSGAAGSAEDLL